MNALPEYKRFLKSILSLLILAVLSVNVCGLGYGDFRYGENHLRRKHSAEVDILQMTSQEIVKGLPIDIYNHTLRVGRIAVRIGHELGLAEDSINLLEHAVWAHDLGQVRNLDHPETLHFIKFELQRVPKEDRIEPVKEHLARWLDVAGSKYGISPEEIARVRGLVGESGDYYYIWEMYIRYAALGGEEKMQELIENGTVTRKGIDVVSRTLYSHGIESVRILEHRNIASSHELNLLVVHHHNYREFDIELTKMVKRGELTKGRADFLRLLESIIIVSDSFEQGNNYERLVENRRLERVETFDETINGWIRKRFDEIEDINERRPLEALKMLIERMDEELFGVIADARQTTELMPGDIEFIDAQRSRETQVNKFGSKQKKVKKMKLGIVHAFSKGAELNQYVEHLLRGYSYFIERGEIDVVVFAYKDEKLRDGDFHKVKVEDEIRAFVRIRRGNDAELIEAVKEEKVDFLKLVWRQNSPEDMPKPEEVERWADFVENDAKQLNIKVGLFLVDTIGIIKDKHLFKRVAESADRVYVFFKDYIKDTAKIYGIPVSKIKKTHHGFFNLGKDPDRDDNRFKNDRTVFVGSIGRWGFYKRVKDQIDAAKRFLKDYPKSDVIFVVGGGDNPNTKGYTEKTIKHYSQDNDVFIIVHSEVKSAIDSGEITDGISYREWLKKQSQKSGKRIIYRPGFVGDEEWDFIIKSFDISMQLYPSAGPSGPVHEMASQGQAILTLDGVDFRRTIEEEGILIELVESREDNDGRIVPDLGSASEKLARLIYGDGENSGDEIRLEIAQKNWKSAQKLQPEDLAKLYYKDFKELLGIKVDIIDMAAEEILELVYPGNAEIVKHIKNVAAYSEIAGEYFELSEEVKRILRAAAFAHDIGGVLGNKEDERVESGIFALAREHKVELNDREPEDVIKEFIQKRVNLSEEQITSMPRMDHGANSVRKLKATGVNIPYGLEIIIRYHQDMERAKAVKAINEGSFSTEEKQLLLKVLAALVVGDIFEFGNNYYKHQNPEMNIKRRSEFETPQETIDFLKKHFKKIGLPSKFAEQLEPLVQDEKFLAVIKRSRMPIEEFNALKKVQTIEKLLSSAQQSI